MNVLQIVRSVCSVVGIPRPNSIVSSTDQGVLQLLELLNEEGTELASRGPWQALTQEATFVTVATESQGTLVSIIGAANNHRHILNETIWNRSSKEPVVGALDPAMWQAYKAFGVTGETLQYRIRGGELLFLQVPTAGETCAFEYATKNWLTDAAGTAFYSAVDDDTDVPRLDDEIILAGLRWRWRAAKGLEYGEDHRKYETRVIDALAKDGTKARKNIAGSDHLDNIPMAIPRLIGS